MPNYKNMHEFIQDTDMTGNNSLGHYAHKRTAYIIAYPDTFTEDEFQIKVREPALELVKTRDLLIDFVFIKQKMSKADYTTDEWNAFMTDCIDPETIDTSGSNDQVINEEQKEEPVIEEEEIKDEEEEEDDKSEEDDDKSEDDDNKSEDKSEDDDNKP